MRELSDAAQEALVDALTTARAYTAEGRLVITARLAVPVLSELVGLLSGVRVQEWPGLSGRYRSYVGTLPCGLPVEVITSVDEVPRVVELPEGGDPDAR